jgi:5-methylcytosine-specific restriction endonuclease McrA
MPRECLACGASLGTGERCRCSERRRIRSSPSRRGYDAAWARLSKRARELQPFCSWCGATEDLTCDHVRPVSRGGKTKRVTLADVQVLCRACNSAKGNRLDTDPGLPPREEPQPIPAPHASRWSLSGPEDA